MDTSRWTITKKLKNVREYKYLGIIFDKTRTDKKEINSRIIQARRAIRYLDDILWSREISKKRKYIYETMIKSSLLYGVETWRVTERNRRKPAVEIDAIRKALRISRRDWIRNEEIKNRMGIEGTIAEAIEKRKLIWYGHINSMGKGRLLKQCLEWQSPEYRKRGSPKTNWTTNERTESDNCKRPQRRPMEE
ncbi:PREDICTED: uncharacterized protein LOC108765651 [Trachymyrmex cornetzi]|uniref:uncharacterized protein LOC108765651 n=1 Tax=Trachymyrmex cornetzi TaxID=471704 RepID=UPI00084EDC9C|nr:PREDICTED: uncharacterized protein LOC108765651 [Trachymyrmex cornetzi]